MSLCQSFVQMWSTIDGETVMWISFKHFVSFQMFGKRDTVFQAASDAEVLAYVVGIGFLKYTQSPETLVVPVAVSVDGANPAFRFELQRPSSIAIGSMWARPRSGRLRTY